MPGVFRLPFIAPVAVILNERIEWTVEQLARSAARVTLRDGETTLRDFRVGGA